MLELVMFEFLNFFFVIFKVVEELGYKILFEI